MTSPAITDKDVTAPATFLRRALVLDALMTSGNGLLYLLASEPIAEFFNMRSTPLLVIGAFLVAYGITVAAIARPSRPAPWPTRLVIEANIGWALVSIVAAVFGWLGTNPIGTAWTVTQACAVAGFAALQWVGLKKLKARAAGLDLPATVLSGR
jgi:hypothetical protein